MDGLSVWLDDFGLVGRIVCLIRFSVGLDDCLFDWMISGWLDGLSVCLDFLFDWMIVCLFG